MTVLAEKLIETIKLLKKEKELAAERAERAEMEKEEMWARINDELQEALIKVYNSNYDLEGTCYRTK